MDVKTLFNSTSNAIRLFQVQSILGVIGSTVPLDAKFDDFRHSVFDAMLAVVNCSEVLSKLYESEGN